MNGYGVAGALIGASKHHTRHMGQVVSKIDYACLVAGLPMFCANKVREQDGSVKKELREDKAWHQFNDEIIMVAKTHEWTAEELELVGKTLQELPETCAKSLWNEAAKWPIEKQRYNIHRRLNQSTQP